MAEVPEGIPVLIALTPNLGGRRWTLEQDEFLIGRGPDCNLVVSERQVSRHHARIRRTPAGYVVEDLGSRNGTHVNGMSVEGEMVLQDGDVIQIALALELAFVGTEATVPLVGAEGREGEPTRLRMDAQAHRVWVAGVEIDPPLSPPQYRLLEVLYQNRDSIVSREQIVECVWPGTRGAGVSEQAIDALVRRLRDRLAEADPERAYIVTVRGHGFRLTSAVRR